MKKIIFGAMAAAALLACSKEQVIEQNRANDEIGFSVVAENQTKAAAVYCANNLLPEFDVAATYTKYGATKWYFQNDNIKSVNDAWVNQTTTRYWSADGEHDFYAIYNGTMNLTAIDEAPAAPTVNFTPDLDVTKQIDLLYAVTKGLTKSGNPVALNFRHALSQIEFKAKNTNPELYVEITGVEVGQTPGVGLFTYPTEDTDDKFVDHEQKETHNYKTGTWEVETPKDYTVTFPAVAVAGNGNAVGLTLSTDAADKNKRNFLNSMLLLPATTQAWDPTTGGGNNGEGAEGSIPEEINPTPDPDIDDDNDEGPEPSGPGHAMRRYNTASAGASDVTGSYLAVECKIYNVAGGTYDEDTDVCIYDGWAMIPAAFTWEPGKKYIYTFVFGKGDFGYNGGNGDTPTPNGAKVLTAMNYDVTVDDFALGAETNMNMTL